MFKQELSLDNDKLKSLLNIEPKEWKNGIGVYTDKSKNNFEISRLNPLYELGGGVLSNISFSHLFRYAYALKNIKNKDTILDIGCGYCNLKLMLYRNRYKIKYIGIDISLPALKYAISQKTTNPYLLIKKDISLGLPFNLESIDKIIMFEVIEHFEKDVAIKILKEAHRVIKNNGTFLLSTPNKINENKLYEDHIYEWKLSELKETLNSIGFTIIDTFGCYYNKDSLHLSKIENEVYLNFKRFLPPSILNQIFASAHPEYSNSIVLKCVKRS